VRGAGVRYLILDRGRWLERHDAKRVRERLLVPARAILGCPAWGRNMCGLLVQWLLLPGHKSWGHAVTWCGQEGLRALLPRWYQAGVHGDVPLPWVVVHWPWRSDPTVVASGTSGGRGGVARVTTTTATAAVVPAAVATTVAAIVVVVVLTPIVVPIGWSGWHGWLQLRSQRRSAGVEHCRCSRWPSGIQVDLLQKEVIVNFKEVQEWRGASDDGPEMLKVLVEAAKDVENDDTVVDEQPELD
jgi:hypothetical protein